MGPDDRPLYPDATIKMAQDILREILNYQATNEYVFASNTTKTGLNIFRAVANKVGGCSQPIDFLVGVRRPLNMLSLQGVSDFV